jgi:hypothetical protein
MVERTSIESALWVLVAADDKNHAQIEVLRAVYRAIDRAVGGARARLAISAKMRPIGAAAG